MAEKNTKLIEFQKAAKGGLGKAMGHLEKAQASHDKMGDHITAMEKACKAFETGDLAKDQSTLELRKGLTTSIEALRAEHGKMEDHHDNIEAELEDLQESATEDEDEASAADAKKAREDRMRKRITREVRKDNAKILAEIEKRDENMMKMFGGLTSTLEKMAGQGLNPGATVQQTKGAPQIPARTAVSVEKAADVTGAPAVAATAAAVPGTVVAGPQLVKAILPNGMPNPAYTESAVAQTGEAFQERAAKAELQSGDPFPREGTMQKFA